MTYFNKVKIQLLKNIVEHVKEYVAKNGDGIPENKLIAVICINAGTSSEKAREYAESLILTENLRKEDNKIYYVKDIE